MEVLAASITERLFERAQPERAASERAYLKSQREFLGVSVPDVRRVVREAVRETGHLDRDQVRDLAARLWAGPKFECRRAAVEVLHANVATLGPADLDLVEELVRDGETWALVDQLATGVAGSIVARGVDGGVGDVLDRWSTDPDSFWVRRASMLALLPSLRRRDGEWARDWERFCRYADQMMGEQEFFIRKAIGWVLRDISRRRPEDVSAYVTPRLDRMSGVTRREATKYL